MKILRCLLLLALMVGCSKGNGDNTPKKPIPISENIYGEWEAKSGDITGYLLKGICSQTIEFKANGNYSEIAYDTKETSQRTSEWVKSDCIGNWNGCDNRIALNDWDGNILKDSLYIVELSEESLVIRYKESEVTYVRKQDCFKSLETEIVAYWQDVTESDKKGYIEIKQDGTGEVLKYMSGNYGTDGLATRGTFTWWIENNSLMRHSDTAAYGINECSIIEFINDKYLGIDGLVKSRK